jgi:hypothetical protein
MRKLLRRCCESKRECITYIVILLWILLGLHANYNQVSLTDTAAYFLSLTGFIGSFIYAESVRKSTDSSIFVKGPNSKRESLTYFVVVIWAIIGFFTIYNKASIIETSTYFAALTPFVGAYLIGETHRAENNYVPVEQHVEQPIEETPIEQINS